MALSSSIVITGGFGALGSAIGMAAAEAGARVCLIGHGAPPAAETLPANVLCIGAVDLTDTQAASAALQQAAGALGGIDALVNVAGGFQWQTVTGDAFDAWDRMYSMNLKTAVVATRAALPWLRARSAARIVNVGAMAALSATAGMGAYAASKAGVLKLTEALAAELADEGINVNAVLPSIIDTPQNRRDMPDADTRNWVRAQDLARVVLFFLGPDSAAVTGAALPVTLGPRGQAAPARL
jgi:NAD(P)-dependent dehydrogenase (short-subunit alcohol dehydrogenase family)